MEFSSGRTHPGTWCGCARTHTHKGLPLRNNKTAVEVQHWPPLTASLQHRFTFLSQSSRVPPVASFSPGHMLPQLWWIIMGKAVLSMSNRRNWIKRRELVFSSVREWGAKVCAGVITFHFFRHRKRATGHQSCSALYALITLRGSIQPAPAAPLLSEALRAERPQWPH